MASDDADALWLSFDVACLKAAFVPGTGWPEPDGVRDLSLEPRSKLVTLRPNWKDVPDRDPLPPREDTAPLTDERDTAMAGPCLGGCPALGPRESAQGFVLVFDEIQKIPDWSDTIKGLWDADRARHVPLHVVVLGSAPLPMQSGLSESLAGRFEPIRLTHWAFPEMSAAFDLTLDEYIYFGGYPGAATLIRDEERWRDYILHALVEPHPRA